MMQFLNNQIILVLFSALIFTRIQISGSAEQLNKIYECTFDLSSPANCGAKVKSSDTFSYGSISTVLITGYKITDVTSITSPTANNEICVIPFNYTDIEYYHCTYLQSSCITTSGTFSKCNDKGKLYYTKPAASNDPYSVELTFPAIDIPTPGGNYMAKFYTLFDCNVPGCEEAFDYISFKLKENDNSTILEREYLGYEFEKKRVWLPREVKFSPKSDKLNMVFGFFRLEKFAATAHLMIDNIEIFEVENVAPESTTIQIFTSSNEPATSITIEPIEETTTTEPIEETTTTNRTEIITTTKVESVSTGSIEQLSKIYECTFDLSTEATCGAKAKATGTFNYFRAKNVLLNEYRITDITSITKPTTNGETCAIPFNYTNVEYYHCTNLQSSCITTNGEYSKCIDGNLYFTKPSATNDPYSVELTFPTIETQQPGKHILKFYTLFYCNTSGCENAIDYLNLDVKDGIDTTKSLINREYYLNSFEPERVWIKREIKFNAPSYKLNMKIGFYRLEKFAATSYIMIDNIEIFRAEDVSATSTEPTNTLATNGTTENSTIAY